MTKSRKLLFSVGAADCDWSYTKGSGAGGQKRNKTSSAVHCTHRASSAHAYSEASRSQHDNKRDAFLKMIETSEYKRWHRQEVYRLTGVLDDIEERVQQELSSQNLKFEVKEDGKWREVDISYFDAEGKPSMDST